MNFRWKVPVRSAISIPSHTLPPIPVSDSEELRVIVYQGDGGFVALCPVFPGVTGEGPTREACVEDLQCKIELLRSASSEAEG